MVKLVIPGISFLNSFILELIVVLVTKLVILVNISNTSSYVINSLWFKHYIHLFLTTLFLTTSLSLLKSAARGTNLSTSNLSTLLFKLFKLIGTFFNLLISNLSSLDFWLAKSTLLANSDVSTPAAFF